MLDQGEQCSLQEPEASTGMQSKSEPQQAESHGATEPGAVSVPARVQEGSDRFEQTAEEQEATAQQAVTAPASCASIAPAQTEQSTPAENLDVSATFWGFVRGGRLSLAYHVARASASLPDAPTDIPCERLVRAAALSHYVGNAYDEIVRLVGEDVRQLIETLQNTDIDEMPTSYAMLTAAATLRPALIAGSATRAGVLLRTVISHFKTPGLYEYITHVASSAECGLEFVPESFRAVMNREAILSDFAALRRDVVVWRERAINFTCLLERGTDVWRYWLLSGKIISQLLDPVVANDCARIDSVRELVALYSDGHQIDRLVDNTDRRELGQKRGRPIEARALRQLRCTLQEALKLASRWLALSANLPRNESRTRQETEIRETLLRLQSPALDELSQLDLEPQNVLGTHCLSAAIKDIGMLLGGLTGNSVLSAPGALLSMELLQSPCITLDEEWMPELDDALGLIRELTTLSQLDTVNWQQAFDRQMGVGNHKATARILDQLRAVPFSGADLNQMEERRSTDIVLWREQIRRLVSQANRKIEGAVALSLLEETERTQYAAQTEGITASLDSILDFKRVKGQLQHIEEDLINKSRPHLESARRRLEGGSALYEPRDYTRILKLLDSGDFLTANEYMDLLQQGDVLPPAIEARTRFGTLFPDEFQQAAQFLQAPATRQTLGRTIRDREKLMNCDLQAVMSHDQAAVAANVIETWFRIKRGKGNPIPLPEQIRDILTFLGFGNPRVSGADRDAKLLIFPAATDVPKSPVPAFGSEAEGHYRIVCAFDRKNEADIIEDLGTVASGSPFVVFYFGRLTVADRRSLAQLCRTHRRTALVIDDVLLLLLCCERPSRIQALFDFGLPFSYLRPYTSKPGYVPSEMFYGRSRERDSITSPNGACFIYGGRQLGKSALLRQVRDDFHAPEANHYSILLDLENGVRIEIDRPIDDIWVVLRQELQKAGVILGKQAMSDAGALATEIESFLRADVSRRILILLDEADRFVTIDASQKFARLRRFKSLMEMPGIDRRFKVVFAGLHNVLRTTRDMNNPLAHLQDPLCIGPLLDHGEWRMAQELIERPLSSLGYVFESRDLLMPILSKTNYYPSLIQLFCMRLLDYLDDPRSRRFDPRSSPPFVIRRSHVDYICTDLELRNQIKQRFDLTLDLDPRYGVIARTVALQALEDGRGLIEGIDWLNIREKARQWNVVDLHESSNSDAFRALLDEMVGLGVLRIVDGGRYALRSPNVLSFMGSYEEIFRGIEEAQPKPELPYAADTFRASLPSSPGGEKQAHVRSPLTAQQTSGLLQRANGVTVLFGSEGLDIQLTPVSLELAFENQSIFRCSAVLDNDFRKFMDGLRFRNPDGVTLALVDWKQNWTASWVESAMVRLRRFHEDRGPLRILFIADPSKAWSWHTAAEGRIRQLFSQGLRSIELRRWDKAAVEQWLLDCECKLDAASVEEVWRRTAAWPVLLHHLLNQLRVSDGLEVALGALANSIADPVFANEVLTKLGVDCAPGARQLLHTIGTQPTTADDLCDFFVGDELLTRKAIERLLAWSAGMQFAFEETSPAGMKRWSVGPVVASLLANAARSAHA